MSPSLPTTSRSMQSRGSAAVCLGPDPHQPTAPDLRTSQRRKDGSHLSRLEFHSPSEAQRACSVSKAFCASPRQHKAGTTDPEISRRWQVPSSSPPHEVSHCSTLPSRGETSQSAKASRVTSGSCRTSRTARCSSWALIEGRFSTARGTTVSSARYTSTSAAGIQVGQGSVEAHHPAPGQSGTLHHPLLCIMAQATLDLVNSDA